MGLVTRQTVKKHNKGNLSNGVTCLPSGVPLVESLMPRYNSFSVTGYKTTVGEASGSISWSQHQQMLGVLKYSPVQ